MLGVPVDDCARDIRISIRLMDIHAACNPAGEIP